ncbi:Plant transposon protein [Fragilaria crotonensis]|nr:Plant transposon protein [Fragilaria crotonensis]
MMSNDDLNEICEALLDKDGFWVKMRMNSLMMTARSTMTRSKSILLTRTQHMFGRNLLFSLMKIVEDEEMDKTEVDAVAFREQFRRQHRGNKKRRKAKRKWYCDPITGKMRRVCPHLSNWWLDYIQNPEPDCPSWNKVFRQRFRLPYPSYIQILEWVSGDDCDGLFDRWRTEAEGFTGRRNNKKVSPIELLLLGTLRYLGRGWTLTTLKRPPNTADLRNCESEYAVAGFPGCIGSTDATHIPLDKVTASFRQAHLGYKMGSDATTRTYNLTVNHRRQILHTTTGHPGRWNDKTLVRFDSFMADLRDGAFDDMVDFTLKRRKTKDNTVAASSDVATEEDDVENVTIKGAYVIVDNGYLTWPTTIPPMKDTCNRSELRFSQWLEALRKT